jgi:phosphatidylserine/phosphatidylglycerophosphate/cardiolipin synthase-like enzyme
MHRLARLLLLVVAALPGACGAPEGTPEIYFCPADDCARRVIERIDGAESTIVAAVFTFSHDGIKEALGRAATERGVKVWVVVEEAQLYAGVASYLRARGVGFRVDGNPQLMHDKFVVVDERTVGTGSFNYTVQADTQNDENLVFFESTDLAARYFDEFQRLWDAGREP